MEIQGKTAPKEVSSAALAKSVIFMVPDGFGDAAAAAYRYFKGPGEAPAWEAGLQASVQTSSANDPVTDSAAAATAYATGVKTDNGGVAVDPEGNPLISILDLASDAGKATGIVTSDSVAGGTPAPFAASNTDRDNRDEIAQEYVDNGDLDLVLGGGLEDFVFDPDDDGSTTLEEAEAAGFDFVSTREELLASDSDQLLGLFGLGPLGLPIGGENEPTLAEMTETALQRLSQDEDGFFLLVEEAGTDIWGHANDAAAVMRSAEAYEEAVRVALQYAERNPDTLVISVADHETGGMTLELEPDRTPAAFQSYEVTYVEMLAGVLEAILDLGLGADEDEIIATVQAAVSELTGGAVSLSANEVVSIAEASSFEDAYFSFAALLNEGGGIDFSTTSHTAADVSLYAFGAGADLREGKMDNTMVADWLAEAMGVSFPPDQQGRPPEIGATYSGNDVLADDRGTDASVFAMDTTLAPRLGEDLI